MKWPKCSRSTRLLNGRRIAPIVRIFDIRIFDDREFCFFENRKLNLRISNLRTSNNRKYETHVDQRTSTYLARRSERPGNSGAVADRSGRDHGRNGIGKRRKSAGGNDAYFFGLPRHGLHETERGRSAG